MASDNQLDFSVLDGKAYYYLSVPGHAYFDLETSRSQLICGLFRGNLPCEQRTSCYCKFIRGQLLILDCYESTSPHLLKRIKIMMQKRKSGKILNKENEVFVKTGRDFYIETITII